LRQRFEAALDDNLNTAEALGAIFDMVRDGNTAMDQGDFHEGDRAAFLKTLERWDCIFAVLEDTDHAKLVKLGFLKPAAATVAASATDTGKEAVAQEVGNGLPATGFAGTLSEEAIEKQIAERAAARRRGDYARSDEIRANLLKAGVILEDTKAGVRWKRR
jgi:cysteinyl-tRNA synthetase